MSITLTEIIEDSLHTPTRRELRYRLTDHVGGEYVTRKIVDSPAFDAVADLAATATQVEAQLDEEEQERIEKRVLRGGDVLALVQTPIHSTDKKLAKKLIRALMRAGKSDDPAEREKAIYLAIMLKPLVDWMAANLSPAQIRNFLDITAGQLSAMNTRLNKVYSHYADLLSFLDTFENWD